MSVVDAQVRCESRASDREIGGVLVDAWYCWTLTYSLMIMATVGMRVGRQPAAAEVGGGRSQAHPIRSDPIRSDPIRSDPLSGQQQVTGRSSKAHRRSGRVVSYRIVSPC